MLTFIKDMSYYKYTDTFEYSWCKEPCRDGGKFREFCTEGNEIIRLAEKLGYYTDD